MRTRTLPLVIVECCTRYIVSELHWVPPCPLCGLIPRYLMDTTWWLEMEMT